MSWLFYSQEYRQPSVRYQQRLVLSCRAPPTALLPNARYERIIEAFGCKGYFAQNSGELVRALKDAFDETSKPTLINVMINPSSERKPQVNKIGIAASKYSFVFIQIILTKIGRAHV